MGRRNLYSELVEPFLEDITKMYKTMTEGQIAKKLGVSTAAFEKYKNEHSELVDCLTRGKKELAEDLKDSLRKKAKGFYYTETKKTYVVDADGNKTGEVRVEKTKKYAVPDLGSIHLLLKNLDTSWRNDDETTLELKRQKLELEKQKAENSNW